MSMTSTEESDDEYMQVNTNVVAQVLTCPLCHEFFDDATAITECLHTFCRQCIYRKLSEEGARRCPECNVFLGPAPLDRLKQHEFLNTLRDMFFPKQDGRSSPATIHNTPVSSPSVPPEGASPVAPELEVAAPIEPDKETVKTNGVIKFSEAEASAMGDTSFSSDDDRGTVDYENDSMEEFSDCSTSSETSNNPPE